MKKTERKHLKENELQTLARQARETFESRQREITAIVVTVAVVGVIGLGYMVWREHVQGKAHALLADAETVLNARVGPPPAPGQPEQGLRFATERERAQAALTKLKIAADAYPSTDAGIYARYQQGVTYMTLGDPSGGEAAFQQVISAAGDGIYGQMATLGLAEAQERAGKYDQAIKTFQDLAQRREGPLPIDGVLMELGRAYRDAGKRADAERTFNRVVQEFPDSTLIADAKRELDSLKKA